MSTSKNHLGIALSASLLLVSAAGASEPLRSKPRGAGDTPKAVSGGELPGGQPALINEGFEQAIMPPSGWTRHRNHSTENWTVYAWGEHSGSVRATVSPSGAEAQEEVLYSPLVFGTTNFSLRFWSEGSLFWCRDINNNCDLNVYLDPDRIWNNGNEILVLGEVEQAWPSDFTWAESTVDLSAYADGTHYHIAFAYTSLNGAAVSLDDIEIFGESGGELFADGFETGDGSQWIANPPMVATHFSYPGPPVALPDFVGGGSPTTVLTVTQVTSTSLIADVLVNIDVNHEAGAI